LPQIIYCVLLYFVFPVKFKVEQLKINYLFYLFSCGEINYYYWAKILFSFVTNFPTAWRLNNDSNDVTKIAILRRPRFLAGNIVFGVVILSTLIQYFCIQFSTAWSREVRLR